MLKFGAYHQHGACAQGNEIMNNVSQQVMKGEKVTQSKSLYIISLVCPVVVVLSRHPSIQVPHPQEEDDGRGGRRRMAAIAVYPNVYVIQSCSL
jgi:hypothetical protein